MMDKNDTYRLRAHHILCLHFFQGAGYSDEFVENMAEIKNKLEKNPQVCITDQADIICRACPNHVDGKCLTAEKADEYDRQVLQRCNISTNQTMTFRELENLVRQQILLPGKRQEICHNCQWDALCHENNPQLTEFF